MTALDFGTPYRQERSKVEGAVRVEASLLIWFSLPISCNCERLEVAYRTRGDIAATHVHPYVANLVANLVGSQDSSGPKARMGKPKRPSASVLVDAITWLVVFGALITLSLWAAEDRQRIRTACNAMAMMAQAAMAMITAMAVALSA